MTVVMMQVVPVVLLLFRNPGTGVVNMVRLMTVVMVANPVPFIQLFDPEPLEVCLHLPQVQGTLRPSPFIDHLGDSLEGRGVTTAMAGPKATTDEEVAVNELMQEGRDEEAAAVFDISKDGRRQDNESLEAAVTCAAQSCGANDIAIVLNAGFVRPVPHDTLA